jgi:quercetin dioxygenase-like cupin family protein
VTVDADPSRSSNRSGDGWSFIDGLADAFPGTVKTDYERPRSDRGRAIPAVSLLGRFDGTSVVRLAFRDGDVMADHRAAAPILILGQTGSIDVTVAHAGDDGLDHVLLTAGSALHVAAERVHSLTAEGPATATLVILG